MNVKKCMRNALTDAILRYNLKFFSVEQSAAIFVGSSYFCLQSAKHGRVYVVFLTKVFTVCKCVLL